MPPIWGVVSGGGTIGAALSPPQTARPLTPHVSRLRMTSTCCWSAEFPLKPGPISPLASRAAGSWAGSLFIASGHTTTSRMLREGQQRVPGKRGFVQQLLQHNGRSSSGRRPPPHHNYLTPTPIHRIYIAHCAAAKKQRKTSGSAETEVYRDRQRNERGADLSRRAVQLCGRALCLCCTAAEPQRPNPGHPRRQGSSQPSHPGGAHAAEVGRCHSLCYQRPCALLGVALPSGRHSPQPAHAAGSVPGNACLQLAGLEAGIEGRDAARAAAACGPGKDVVPAVGYQ